MSSRSNVISIAEYHNKRYTTPKISNSESGAMLGKGLTDQVMIELVRRFSDPNTEKDYRNRALLSLMSQTGLRAKEVVSLKFSQLFQASSGEMLISYIKKGRRTGYSVIPKNTLEFIRKYHYFIGESHDYFFLSLPNRNGNSRSHLSTRGLQLIVNSWDVKTCSERTAHPHAFRHTVGAKLLETSGSIAAQKVLGHSTPVTTSKYYTKPYFDGSKYLTWE
ncbi:tyrosine-type recombinase/integrase [Leptospira weilii]|uniref:tyrosine-type recombinase/integrase n=1 Tax=Leptospira weilii TaxID=28184 RepID=UPI0002E878C3|nr:tyrosine-type recombinase/integrase [Leptospira weilii]OMI16890.1 recombinase XerC [Leptospira weilii serovar Heyan]ULH27442.1 tyrosine-type recombinase/integrase [Leptospira weilii]UPY77566.1 tyrosine-type recombinase/integrase [Leptospira weilii]